MKRVFINSSVNAVQQFGATCISVGYRLAPEHPFPTPINDAWDSLQWVMITAIASLQWCTRLLMSTQIASNAHKLGADPEQGFVVHGESAGGNFAIVLALLARDNALKPRLTGVSALIPAVLSPEVVPQRFGAEYQSRKQNEFAPGLSTRSLDYLVGKRSTCSDVTHRNGGLTYLVGHYSPDVLSPLFNCFVWPTGHQDLPPVHISVCGRCS